MAVLSVSELTTFRWTFEQDIENFAAAGIPAVGVWRQKLSDYGEDKGIELLAEHGLQVSSLHWAGGFTGSEGRSHRESIDDARDAIRLAADLKTRNLIVYSGSRAGHTHKHARRLLRNALAELLPVAEDYDVCLAIEPMHSGCAGEWTFLTDLDETLALLDDCGSTHLKMTFDTYQLGHDETNVARAAEVASRVAIVHLGDANESPSGEQNRLPLGAGSLPINKMVGGLQRGGYDGFYEVELMGEEIEACDYAELLSTSKEALAAILRSSAS